MGRPQNGIYIIQGEISLVVTAMKRSSRWVNHTQQVRRFVYDCEVLCHENDFPCMFTRLEVQKTLCWLTFITAYSLLNLTLLKTLYDQLTVNQILFVCKIFLQDSHEHHHRKYFSSQTTALARNIHAMNNEAI